MMKTEAKAAKVDPAEKKEIEKLFKQGLEAALKDPEKFWDEENKRTAKTPVSKFLATLPMVHKKSKGKGKGKGKGKQESLVSELNDLLDSVKDD